MNRHEHHVVHITGGAQGLGAAMAHRFATEDVVAAIRQHQRRLGETTLADDKAAALPADAQQATPVVMRMWASIAERAERGY